MKSHLQSYPCPLQINSFWNLGLLLGITIILQIIHPIIGFIFKIIPEIVNRKSGIEKPSTDSSSLLVLCNINNGKEI
jgi:hypothetical protein